MIIAIDFDGTCVQHDYPDVGKAAPHAATVLRQLVVAGHRLILWTMRDKEELIQAVAWFEERKIPLWSVNMNPEQHTWTSSPKVFANLYIDDAAAGTPLLKTRSMHRPVVDWMEMAVILKQMEVLPCYRKHTMTRSKKPEVATDGCYTWATT